MKRSHGPLRTRPRAPQSPQNFFSSGSARIMFGTMAVTLSALQDFTPTPEIAEAQALMERLAGTFYLSKTYHVDSAGLCAQADGSYWVRFSARADGAGTGMPSKSNALAWIDVGRVVTVIS
jgi:hypothetical protein